MAWESRTRGGRYYTRSRKVRGRVVREYIGGAAGEAMAQLDTLERAQRHAAAAQWQHERAQLAACDATMRDYCRQVDALMRGELIAAGFCQHDRGDWRRKRAHDAHEEAARTRA